MNTLILLVLSNWLAHAEITTWEERQSIKVPENSTLSIECDRAANDEVVRMHQFLLKNHFSGAEVGVSSKYYPSSMHHCVGQRGNCTSPAYCAFVYGQLKEAPILRKFQTVDEKGEGREARCLAQKAALQARVDVYQAYVDDQDPYPFASLVGDSRCRVEGWVVTESASGRAPQK